MKPLIILAAGPRRTRPSRSSSLSRVQVAGRVWLAITTLVLSTLACGLTGRGADSVADHALTRLPTLTRTPLPTLTPTSLARAAVIDPNSESPAYIPPPVSPVVDTAATPNVVKAADAAPSLTDIPTATATATSPAIPANVPANPPTSTPVVETEGWAFANVQGYDDQYEDGLLLYGEVINNTGVAQQFEYISGTFYDAQGQIIADENSTGDYWPFKLIPPVELRNPGG